MQTFVLPKLAGCMAAMSAIDLAEHGDFVSNAYDKRYSIEQARSINLTLLSSLIFTKSPVLGAYTEE